MAKNCNVAYGWPPTSWRKDQKRGSCDIIKAFFQFRDDFRTYLETVFKWSYSWWSAITIISNRWETNIFLQTSCRQRWTHVCSWYLITIDQTFINCLYYILTYNAQLSNSVDDMYYISYEKYVISYRASNLDLNYHYWVVDWLRKIALDPKKHHLHNMQKLQSISL